MFCWYAREKWGSQFIQVACEDCLEVCFFGLVVELICVWCLVIAAIFVGFGQAGARMCGRCLKVINWGWRCKSQNGGSSHRVGRFLLCNIAVMWNFMQVLLGIHWKRFYWVPLFTILLLFYVFEFGKAKSATQSVLMKHLMGYSRKIYKFFASPLKIDYP